MNDKHIEDLLRDTLRATPSEDMRGRTLRLARQELKKQQTRSPILGTGRWTAALAVCGVLIIALTSISNSARQDRIDRMVCSPSAGPQAQIARASALQDWESRRAEILDRLHEIEGTDPL